MLASPLRVRVALVAALLLLLWVLWPAPPAPREPDTPHATPAPPRDPLAEYYRHDTEHAVFETGLGTMRFAFFPLAAPRTVAQFKRAVADGYFDSCHFYRQEPNFVLQGGCHIETTKPPLPTLPLEYKLPNVRGMVSMARTSNPNSATSEFAIQLGDNARWLGPGGSDAFGYAVFMELVAGWDAVAACMLPQHRGKRISIRRAYLAPADAPV